MVAQHFTHGVATERGPPGQALEEHDADGVEVGAVVDAQLDQAGCLGGQVAGGADELVPQGSVEADAPGQAEVDELGPLDGLAAPDDDVRRLDVAVQHPLVVDELQHVQEVVPDLERRRDRQGAVVQAVAQALAVQAGLDEVEELAIVPAGQQRAVGPAVHQL